MTENVVVIDNGTDTIKAGLTTSTLPSITFPTIVGDIIDYDNAIGKQKQTKIGYNAKNNKDTLNLSYPIVNGKIESFNNISKIWKYIFNNELKIHSIKTGIIMSEIPLNNYRNREKIIEIMFETYDIPLFYLCNTSILSLYSNGKINGIICELGAGITNIVPIFDGYSLPYAINQSNVAGRNLTYYLMTMLNKKGYSFKSTKEWEILRKIKEELCYVIDYPNKSSKNEIDKNKTYQLPDGNKIEFINELGKCSEILFKPKLLDKNISSNNGIHELIFNSIMKCDISIRHDLYSNIMLTGGTSMLNGLKNRLLNELQSLIPNVSRSKKIFNNIIANKNRNNAVWIGGSILGSTEVFKDIAINTNEYDEYGPNIVHKKCF